MARVWYCGFFFLRIKEFHSRPFFLSLFVLTQELLVVERNFAPRTDAGTEFSISLGPHAPLF